MPDRIQLSRAKGWRKPPGAVVVARPTKWGNPFRVGDRVRGDDGTLAVCFSAAEAVQAYRDFMDHPIGRRFREAAIAELRGRDLCCWCPIISHGAYVPCHADVLLSIANDIPMEEVIRENTRRAKGETL